MEDSLPKQIVWRKTKIGFEVPSEYDKVNRYSLYEIWAKNKGK